MPPELNNPDAEAQILLASKANDTLKSLDETAEGVLVETSKVKDAIEDLDKTMEAVVVNTSQPTKYVFEVNGAKVATLEGPKGDKGEKGDTPIIDYGLIVKKALAQIPKPKDGVSPVKGVDYFTEKDIADFIKDIKPLIKRGPKGDRGDTTKVDYDVIVAEVLELIPVPKDGKDGKDGSPDSVEDIIKKIKGKLSYRDLKDKPDIGRGGSGLNTVATDGTTIAGTGLGDNPLRVIGGTGGAVDSVNGQTGVVVLDTGDITEVTDKNYVTDAEATLLGGITASATEINYTDGVTSSIQTQLDSKQSTSTFGTGVQTALGVNIGSAGAPVLFDGALGTPSSGTVTNLTGTASININGTVGATTPAAGTFTTLNSSSFATNTIQGGTSTPATTTTSGGQYLGSSSTQYQWRTGAMTPTLTANVNWTSSNFIAQAITEGTSGTHALISNVAIGAHDVTQGTASTTNYASLYVAGPATGTATITNNYALWVDDGASRFDGGIELNAGNMTLGENTSVDLDPALSADGKYSGVCITGTAGTTLAFGDLIYLAVADSRWELADADAATTSDRMLGICVLAAASDGSATKILLHGNIRADAAFPTLTIGAAVYVGETAGDVQTTIPTGADNIIRRVGFALTADELYFNPSQDSQVTVA